jgi:hypothetical protein
VIESARFQQVWELDVPLESLSMRGQNAQFGFVNEESFSLLTKPNQDLIEE